MGIAFQNLGTSPNASTFTSDVGSATKLLSSGQFATYLQQEIYEQSAMVRSGLLAPDARLSNIQGVIAEMPFAAPLDYEEELVNSSNTWGREEKGYYSLQKTQASTQYAPIVTRGAGFAMDDLSRVQTGFDALANIRSQLATDMNRKITAKIISQLNGLFDATNGGPLKDHSIDAEDAGGAMRALTATDIIKAKSLLGERAQQFDILIIHPDVRHHLENLGMTIFEGSPGGPINYASQGIGVTATEIGYFAGMRVISDSQVPVDKGPDPQNPKPPAEWVYTCYLAASGVIRTGAQFPMLIETERNKASLQDAMFVTYNRCDHVIGTSWVAGAYASDPSNKDLADGSNWAAAYLDTRLIPLASIKCLGGGFTSLAPDPVFGKHPSVVQQGTGPVEKSVAAGLEGGPNPGTDPNTTDTDDLPAQGRSKKS